MGRGMGAAIKRLQIPIGEVYSSPYCRCVDSAMNLFGKALSLLNSAHSRSLLQSMTTLCQWIDRHLWSPSTQPLCLMKIFTLVNDNGITPCLLWHGVIPWVSVWACRSRWNV